MTRALRHIDFVDTTCPPQMRLRYRVPRWLRWLARRLWSPERPGLVRLWVWRLAKPRCWFCRSIDPVRKEPPHGCEGQLAHWSWFGNLPCWCACLPPATARWAALRGWDRGFTVLPGMKDGPR